MRILLAVLLTCFLAFPSFARKKISSSVPEEETQTVEETTSNEYEQVAYQDTTPKLTGAQLLTKQMAERKAQKKVRKKSKRMSGRCNSSSSSSRSSSSSSKSSGSSSKSSGKTSSGIPSLSSGMFVK